MKRYVVTLEKNERDELAGVTQKGSHQSQKVINWVILLNSDEGEFNEHRTRGEAIAEILLISARKVDDVKKRGHGSGSQRAAGVAVPATCARPTASFEARLVSRSSAEASGGRLAVVAAFAGGSRRGTRPHRQCVARDSAAGPKKTQSNRGGGSAG